MVTPREISRQMTRVSKVQISSIRIEDGAKNSLKITCERYATDMLSTEVGYIL